MLNICKLPKSVEGRTKGPRGPTSARVFETLCKALPKNV